MRVTGIYSRDYQPRGGDQSAHPVLGLYDSGHQPGSRPRRTSSAPPTTPVKSITYYEYPTSLRGTAFQANTRVNDPLLDATYKSFEIAGSKRLCEQRWQAMVSYSRTQLHLRPAPTPAPIRTLQIFTLQQHSRVERQGGRFLPAAVRPARVGQLRAAQRRAVAAHRARQRRHDDSDPASCRSNRSAPAISTICTCSTAGSAKSCGCSRTTSWSSASTCSTS